MDLDQLTQRLQEVDPLVWIGIAAVVVVLLLLLLLVVTIRRRRRRRRLLEDRYGSEYTRTAEQAGSRRRADQELIQREERRQTYEVRDLESSERDRLRARWDALQAGFIDGPQSAVRSGEGFIEEIANAKGYPDAEWRERLEDVAVDHPAAVAGYRNARTRQDADTERSATTEQLRETMLAIRSVVEMMIGRDASPHSETAPPFRSLVQEDASGPAPTAAASTHPSDDQPEVHESATPTEPSPERRAPTAEHAESGTRQRGEDVRARRDPREDHGRTSDTSEQAAPTEPTAPGAHAAPTEPTAPGAHAAHGAHAASPDRADTADQAAADQAEVERSVGGADASETDRTTRYRRERRPLGRDRHRDDQR